MKVRVTKSLKSISRADQIMDVWWVDATEEVSMVERARAIAHAHTTHTHTHARIASHARTHRYA